MLKSNILPKVLTVLVFSCIFVSGIKPIELGDFWWHLRSGKWIAENQALPESDPFSYTIDVPEKQKRILLTQYWAFQLILHGLYTTVDFDGLILMRSALYTFMFALLYLLLRSYGLSQPLSLAFIICIVPAMLSYIEMRPTLVSYIMALAIFFILEKLRFEKNILNHKGLLVSLPLCMIVWSNMHGGYIIGVGILSIFICNEIFKAIKAGIDTRAMILFSVAGASILAGGLNPSCFDMLSGKLIFGLFTKSGAKDITVSFLPHEYLSPRQFYLLTGDSYYFFSLLIMTAVTILSFVVSYRRLDAYHLALTGIFMSAAYVSFRYGAFFMLFSVAVTGKNLSGFSWARASGTIWRAFIPAAISILLVSTQWPFPRTVFYQGVIPINAADYIEKNKVPAELFAPYEWGGYLIWRLSPEYRSFIDGRVMDEKILNQYRMIMSASPLTDSLLSQYGIKSLLLYNLTPFREQVIPLMFHLLKSDDWSPAYWDTQSVLFVRKDLNALPLEKNTVWKVLTSHAQAKIMLTPQDPKSHLLMGEIYFQRGLTDLARESFARALKLDPDNRKATESLNRIDSQNR